MNLKEKHDVFDKLHIGQIVIVEDWLLRNEIPIKRETLQRITDDQNKTLAFRAKLNMIPVRQVGINTNFPDILDRAVTEVIVKIK